MVELLVVIAIIVALAALATPQIFKQLKRAAFAEALNNAKQVKLALDGFATDFDGQYPNEDTMELITGQAEQPSDSNGYFKQLFLSGETQSESIFWVKNSPIAGGKPDDSITQGGNIAESEILEEGDCHWAYMTEQSNTSNVARPIILDPYVRDGNQFSAELWDNKVIVVRIDSSATGMRIRFTDIQDGKGIVRDGSGNNIISSEADAWQGSGENPSELLEQPLPDNA